jgi:hypothetical protein
MLPLVVGMLLRCLNPSIVDGRVAKIGQDIQVLLVCVTLNSEFFNAPHRATAVAAAAGYDVLFLFSSRELVVVVVDACVNAGCDVVFCTR